jgi:hypothetical protein
MNPRSLDAMLARTEIQCLDSEQIRVRVPIGSRSRRADRMLVHQVHPARLAVDIGATIVSSACSGSTIDRLAMTD